MPRPPLPLGSWGKISRHEAAPGRWRATARFRDFDGRTRQVEAWGATGPKAEGALVSAMTDRADPTSEDVTPHMRVDALAALWLRELEQRAAGGDLARQSLDQYRAVLAGTVVPALGGLTIREVTTKRVDALLQTVAAKHPAKARQVRVVVAGLMGLAVRYDAKTTNPVREARSLKGTGKPARALTVDELRALREGVRTWQTTTGTKGPKRAGDLLDVVDVLLGTGARIGEVLAIRWADVDLAAERPTVTISGTVVQVKGEGLRRQGHPKTAAGWRTIVLPRFAADTLLRLQVAAHGNVHDVVFPSSTGTLRSPHNFRRQWRDARAAAGFTWVTPHTYRKTVATLLDRERDVKTAAGQLGHSGTAVTERHYVAKAAQAVDSSDVLQALAPVVDA